MRRMTIHVLRFAKKFPENIVILVRRRLVCFYAFLSVLLFPAFFSNAIRESFNSLHDDHWV